MYPIPASKDNFVKEVPTASTDTAYSICYGLASVLSVAALILRK